MKPPLMRHYRCANRECKTCLADALALDEYLSTATGVDRKHCDFLGDYRRWLEREWPGVEVETEYGWFGPAVFNPTNINAYVQSWLE